MSQLRHPLLRLGLLSAALVLTGCGQRELPKAETYPVRGRVLVNGEPARFIRVRLEPETPGKGQDATGTTDADGNFELRTWSNDDTPDGAVPGRYRVSLEDSKTPENAIAVPKGVKATLLPDDLRGKEVTTVEVTSEDNDLGDIRVP
jgi:hypothetical protein